MRRIWESLPFRANHSRNRYFFVLDALLLPLAAVVGYAIRFEGWSWWRTELDVALPYLLVAVPLKLLLLWSAGLYRRLWRYASIADLERVLLGGLACVFAGMVIGAVLLPTLQIAPRRVPLAVLFIDGCLTVALIALPRLLVRMLANWQLGRRLAEGRRVLIVGAGAAGGMIVKELLGNPGLGLMPVAFLDDDAAKHHHKLLGVPVIGPLKDLEGIVQRVAVDEVIIALPTAPGRVVREVVQAAARASIATRTVPGVFELISGRKSVSALRRVEIQDLLRREPIVTDLNQVRSLAAGRTVLVSGAGGSIGSELCRQLAGLGPKQILALGRGENSIFELAVELSGTFPGVPVVPLIADVRDFGRMDRIFKQYRPFSVFHAAAHKHVPLMEQNIGEAVINNVLGTRNIATLAAQYGTQHFVFISTDKAVRPTSIMGATKRIAEGVVREVADRTGKHFSSVRFGNVLGSRGSVVPTFMRQIAAGGPVTVTDPEMRRYFMTIPEAVQLVLQAGAMGKGSETFVLDMGEPVKIADLAADLIRLSGLEVGTDIEIRFTGTRPGEKLYEELFFSAENAVATAHPKILCGKGGPALQAEGVTFDQLIAAAVGHAPPSALREMIAELVPDYQPPDGHEPVRRAGGAPAAAVVAEPEPVYASALATPGRVHADGAPA